MIDKNKVIGILSPILQKGFFVRVLTGLSVRGLFEVQFKLSQNFVDLEISTVFLNWKAVDNIDRAIVTDGCELALSGAMPGFVGAAMRRGGYYSSMRSAVSYNEENVTVENLEGTVRIKLYNTLIKLLGLDFACRGFFISEQDAAELLGTELGPYIKTVPDMLLPNSIFITVNLDS